MENPSKLALVTGAGSGVGKAAALALARRGYQVVLAGRRLELLEETADAGANFGADMRCIKADVRDPVSVEDLFSQVSSIHGRLDVLFNNAGVTAPPVPFETLPFEQWQRVVETNLTGAFLCSQWAFRIMKAQQPQGGRIINNGSVSAHVPRPNSAPYAASKHGITGLTRATALDGRAHHIACGQIDIGNAATSASALPTGGVEHEQANGLIATEPQFDVKHVGDAVAYMADLPLDTNILFMTIMATEMPFIGRG